MNPSKELFEAVIGTKTHKLQQAGNPRVIAYFETEEQTNALFINIYELMHLMKEWANKNGYWIDSNLGFVSTGRNGTGIVSKTFNGYDLDLEETELVTKACEWILNEK